MKTQEISKMSKSDIDKMVNELAKTKNDLAKLQQRVANLNTEHFRLKADNHRKQATATRLLVQRNTARFLADKIILMLRETLLGAKCKVARETTPFEMLSVVQELVAEAWGKYETVIKENNKLRQEVNAAREERAILTETIRNLRTVDSASKKEKTSYEDDFIEEYEMVAKNSPKDMPKKSQFVNRRIVKSIAGNGKTYVSPWNDPDDENDEN